MSENQKTFDIDNISFKAIKSSITSIPKIIFNKKHYSLYRSKSVNNTQNNDTLSEGHLQLKEHNNKGTNNIITPNKSKPPKIPICNHYTNPSIKNGCLSLRNMTDKTENEYEDNNDKEFENDNINVNHSVNDTPHVNLLKKHILNKNDHIRQLNKSYKDRIVLIESEHAKQISLIDKAHEIFIEKLKESFENKIKQIQGQYEIKCLNIEKEMIKRENNYKIYASTHISISKHNDIINNLNENWIEKINDLIKEYDSYNCKMSEVFNEKEEYRELLLRLEKYKLNKKDIRTIETMININEEEQKQFGKDYIYQTEMKKIAQLEEEIIYNKTLLDLKVLAEQKLFEIELKKTSRLDNMKKTVEMVFYSLPCLNQDYISEPKSNMSFQPDISFKCPLSRNTDDCPIKNDRYENKQTEDNLANSVNQDTLRSNDKCSIDFEVSIIILNQ